MEGVAFLLLTFIQRFEIRTFSCSLIRFIHYLHKVYFYQQKILKAWLLFPFEHFQIDYMSLSFGNPFNLQAKGCKIRLTVHCFADTVSDFYPNDSHFSVSTWNIGAKASCASFFFSALFILKKMRKKTFRPVEKLTHNFETKQRHKDIMLGNSWVQIQQRVTHTTKSHMMITRGFRPN